MWTVIKKNSGYVIAIISVFICVAGLYSVFRPANKIAIFQLPNCDNKYVTRISFRKIHNNGYSMFEEGVIYVAGKHLDDSLPSEDYVKNIVFGKTPGEKIANRVYITCKNKKLTINYIDGYFLINKNASSIDLHELKTSEEEFIIASNPTALFINSKYLQLE